MQLKFLTLLLLSSFIFVGCAQSSTPKNEDLQDQNEQPEEVMEQVETSEQAPAEISEKLSDISLVSYTNKALGYTIQRPDNWYWRHYTRAEIGNVKPEVDDYFITDLEPILDISSDYPGRIVIEVSTKSWNDLTSKVEGFAKSETKIAGQPAFRYESESNGIKVIEYHFEKDGKTYRIYYNKKDSGQVDEAIFQHLATNISFSN